MPPLQLFPVSGFDRSTTTPVLIGVLVSWLFTEAFGWVFAGLVVPGYLAAVFLLDPRAGLVDVVEAFLTYGLARLLGEHLSRTGITSRVFGRERFLLVVVCSVLVRLLVEGAILPRFAPYAAVQFFSIGLVVVPLAANACWKTGLARGLVQNGVPTLIVYLFLRFVLIRWTNLSLAGFELATEDVAASFLSSPKAYILLLTGAVIAASANVLDGWDFNGILIPALLALVVIEPVRFVATFVEAVVLVIVTTLLLRTTPLGRANIEGPRRIVLFFCVDYALRFCFAWVMGSRVSGGDVVGSMGFGYLLPTLLAVKMAQKRSVALVLVPTVHVSIVSFVVASALGFGALLLDTSSARARESVHRAHVDAPADTIAAALWTAALARRSPLEGFTEPFPARASSEAIERLAAGSIETNANLDVQRLSDGTLLVRERFERARARFGDPAALLTTSGARANGRTIGLVLDPLAHPELAAAGARLMIRGALDGLVIAGLEGDQTNPTTSDAARDLARRLANHGVAGVVVSLRDRGASAPSAAIGPASSRGDHFENSLATMRLVLEALEARPLADADVAGREVDVVLDVPLRTTEAMFTREAGDEHVPVATPALLSAIFADVREGVRPEHDDVENLLALRRLLLEPLLTRSPRSISHPILRLAAGALGYRIFTFDRWTHGDGAFALVPAFGDASFGMVVSAGGVRRRTIEVGGAEVGGMRDLALRLGASLDADAVLLGFGPRSAALRLAHVGATFPTAGREPSLVLLRRGPREWNNAGVAALSSWGGASRLALASDVEMRLRELGIPSSTSALPLAVRDLVGRAVFGEVPVAALVLDARAIRVSSLDAARAAVEPLASVDCPIVDGSVVGVAVDSAHALAANGSKETITDVAQLARRVAMESSVVARRALSAAVARGSVIAAIARTPTGDSLVVVARETSGLVLAVVALDPFVPRVEGASVAADVEGCAEAIATGGSCRVKAP